MGGSKHSLSQDSVFIAGDNFFPNMAIMPVVSRFGLPSICNSSLG